MTRPAKAKLLHKPQRPASTRKRRQATEPSLSFAHSYPAITQWVESYGWIEMGQDGYSRSMVRALDIGGMIWEGKPQYPSLDELLRDLEDNLTAWLDKNGRPKRF